VIFANDWKKINNDWKEIYAILFDLFYFSSSFLVSQSKIYLKNPEKKEKLSRKY
jgi:hypothetical protein